MRSSRNAVARSGLERRLAAWRLLGDNAAVPVGGWVRAIREALGMSASDLAARLGVDRSTVVRLEHNESGRRIQLDTLDRFAHALDCDLVYALVPRRPLEDVVDDRARELAWHELSTVSHSMALEAQDVDAEWVAERLEVVVAQMKNRPRLWAETAPHVPSR